MEDQTGNQDFRAHQPLRSLPTLNSICRVSRDHVGSQGRDPFGNHVLLPFSAGMVSEEIFWRVSAFTIASSNETISLCSEDYVENLKLPSSFRIYKETPLWVSLEAKWETWTAISNGSFGLQHLQSPSTAVVSEKEKKKKQKTVKTEGLKKIQPWWLKW